MKEFWIKFLKRGFMAAWTGPLVVSIVWACLGSAGVIESLEGHTVLMGVVSGIIIAFIAAGINVIYEMEQIPRAMAILIHMAVLYLDYLVIYLLNDWLAVKNIGWFTLIFVVGFLAIWAIILLIIRKQTGRMNALLSDTDNE